jgi:polyphosphate glucokinase
MKQPPDNPKILVLDVGGSHVKCKLSGCDRQRQFASGPDMSAGDMVQGALRLVADWQYDVVSIGYPGVVRNDAPMVEPHNLAPGWVGFDFQQHFGCPVKMLNDAAMQALGAYQGGTMLFLGLGTGLGSALIVQGLVVALELGHLPYEDQHHYEYFVGQGGLERLGEDLWRARVLQVVEAFRLALMPDDVVLGGGNVHRLPQLPPNTRRGDNADAFTGGFRLWTPANRSPPESTA